jgi:hypothetical protein
MCDGSQAKELIGDSLTINQDGIAQPIPLTNTVAPAANWTLG